MACRRCVGFVVVGLIVSMRELQAFTCINYECVAEEYFDSVVGCILKLLTERRLTSGT
ncbi:hypothetical protein M1N11_01165 [Peptococcaceae bacterium]|nr:hypothetical protein [Peptococcaceae bacterium]